MHLLVRGDKLRASRAMQDRVTAHERVEVHFHTTVDDAYPDGKGALDGLHTKDTKTGLSTATACFVVQTINYNRLRGLLRIVSLADQVLCLFGTAVNVERHQTCQH